MAKRVGGLFHNHKVNTMKYLIALALIASFSAHSASYDSYGYPLVNQPYQPSNPQVIMPDMSTMFCDGASRGADVQCFSN